MDKRLKQVLEELTTETYRTSAEVAKALGISEKTVRTRIKELNHILEKNGAVLVSRQRLGIMIKIFNQEQYSLFCQKLSEKIQEQIPVTPEERVDFILTYLLCHDNFIRIEDLGDMMYVSKNTLANDIKRAEAYLQAYDVQIVRKPNYGIKVVGSEFNLRLCVTNYLVKRGILFHSDSQKISEEQAVIGGCIISVFKENEIIIEELSLQSLIYHVYTSIKRIQYGYLMPEFDDRIYTWYDKMDRAVEIAAKIYQALELRWSLSFPEPEIQYLAIHLAGKRVIAGEQADADNFIVSQQIMDLMEEMLEIVYHTFHLDLQGDLELRLAIVKHLVPLDVRLKYHLDLKNPILKEIKENYAMPFMVASQAVLPIQKRYGRAVSEDEQGYFAVLFALAMEKEKTVRKKNILLVCASGKSSAELMAYRYRREFGNYLNRIEICRARELAAVDFSRIDYVFTTVPIQYPVPVPIMEVNVFLEEAEIASLRKALIVENTEFLADYYKRELFFTDLPCRGMEEAIQYLCEKVGCLYKLPEGFCEAVIRREQMSGTDFGNLVALPHPIDVVTDTTFVCVGILEQPVEWRTRAVQCVFLISVSDKEDPNIQRFYQQTTNLAMNKEKIQRLIREADYGLLMELLGEAY